MTKTLVTTTTYMRKIPTEQVVTKNFFTRGWRPDRVKTRERKVLTLFPRLNLKEE